MPYITIPPTTVHIFMFQIRGDKEYRRADAEAWKRLILPVRFYAKQVIRDTTRMTKGEGLALADRFIVYRRDEYNFDLDCWHSPCITIGRCHPSLLSRPPTFHPLLPSRRKYACLRSDPCCVPRDHERDFVSALMYRVSATECDFLYPVIHRRHLQK